MHGTDRDLNPPTVEISPADPRFFGKKQVGVLNQFA